MTDTEKHKRNLCRVLVRADDLLKEGMPLPHGAQIVKIYPAFDTWDGVYSELDHWLLIRHEDLPEVQKGQLIPERRLVIENKEREMGPYTKMIQREARFE